MLFYNLINIYFKTNLICFGHITYYGTRAVMCDCTAN